MNSGKASVIRYFRIFLPSDIQSPELAATNEEYKLLYGWTVDDSLAGDGATYTTCVVAGSTTASGDGYGLWVPSIE